MSAKPVPAGRGFVWAVSDIYEMTRRNLIHNVRLPQLLVFATIQPVMFVLLFVYVFGGAINVPGTNYVNYLLPGILVQTVVFGATQTGIGLAEDLSKGMIDRFRSLPMARSAVLAGRTLADTVRNIFVALLMVEVGYVVGFRFEGGLLAAVGALALAVLFGLAFSWISATIGLAVRDVETSQVAGFVWIFPLVFASSIFVPVQTMPDILQALAKVNPVSLVVDTVRALSLTGTPGDSLWGALAWIAGLLLVFIPLAVNRYIRAV
jgi:ABC-2 type transport system permease protein/oleandomycin transport system permease protein